MSAGLRKVRHDLIRFLYGEERATTIAAAVEGMIDQRAVPRSVAHRLHVLSP